jgi:hypothetical protein
VIESCLGIKQSLEIAIFVSFDAEQKSALALIISLLRLTMARCNPFSL